MATHHGKNGVCKVGANTVAEVRGWNIDETIPTVDNTVQGSTGATHMVGIPAWKGSMDCFWDETDINGQEALTIGASFTFNGYPEGAGAGAKYYSGLASVVGRGVASTHDGGVMRKFDFEGNGPLTNPTV